MPHLNCIDIDNKFTPTFKNVTTRSKQITDLRKFIDNSKEVLLATDDDREGEAIAWHICQLFNLPVATTKRIIFHEVTEKALQCAVTLPTIINMHIVHAQFARQVLDLLVGFKLSPMLWSSISFKTAKPLSAGRCQSPALRIIYENAQTIKASPGIKSYNTIGHFTSKNLEFTLNYNHEGERTMEQYLTTSAEFSHVFSCGDIRNTTKAPPLPFTTSSLQQASNTDLRLSPKDTMASCQKLYEAGYITYMRTDSKTYCAEFLKTASSFIVNVYGSEYVHTDSPELLNNTPKNKKKEAVSAQEAHEAIRPTDITILAVQEDKTIGSREAKMYLLIRQNTLESLMLSATYKGITASITAPDNHLYKHSTEQVVFPGWKCVAGYELVNPIYAYLQTVKQDTIPYKKIRSKVTMKGLISHLSEAKLVQLLEHHGIGRPSTFASLVEKIQERGYVKKTNVVGKEIKCVEYELVDKLLSESTSTKEFGGEKGKLVLQPIGQLVIEFLLLHYDALFQYGYTKIMEDTLDIIAKGGYVWHDLCAQCLAQIDTLSDQYNKTKVEIRIDDKHTYTIAKYGPVVKCVEGEHTTFKQVRDDLDLDKLREGTYSLDEIIAEKVSSCRNLGPYLGHVVVIKKGRYGLYLEWNNSKIAIKMDMALYESLELDDVSMHIVKPILLEISPDASIRDGKYGPYIYYKTPTMKSPKFLSFDKNLDSNCSIKEAKKWLSRKHNIIT